ncbi:MAG: AAA 31 protein [Anaerolineales bacterium]|nr:AAA 31 protein [Anaerolineales bacterium]MBM2850857.1 31 protein [Anaerolineales bacterium]
MPYVIAICHQKGGVAKTTTTLALGACLVEQQCETLLIDLDPQANLTGGMGVDPAMVRRSAADVLLGNETVLRMSRETSVPGLDLVPSNADMVTVAQFLHVRKPYEYILRDSLARPEVAHYEVVLIDCPPALGPITINALTAANLVIIPTQCEYFSMQALDSVLKLVNLVRAKTNPPLVFRLLVTMFDQRGHLHSRILAHLQQHFGNSLLQTAIGFDSKLRESQLVGQPITVHAKQSRGTQQYRQLAEELLTYVRRQVHPTA